MIKCLKALKSFLKTQALRNPNTEAVEKDPEWFCIATNTGYFLYSLNLTEAGARCYQNAQWWHENKSARVVKVCLVEAKP